MTGHWTRARAIGLATAVVGMMLQLSVVTATRAAAAGNPCSPPVSVIACENTLPGDPSSDWQVAGNGDATLQGFATQISVNVGQTVTFKINTSAPSYHIDIVRFGWYGGAGARIVQAGIRPDVTPPQNQPACLTDNTNTTGLIDCGNWAASAHWAVPATAVSGIYEAHLVRDDTHKDSSIVFVVRNDASHSDIIFQTSDPTWEAYNTYGGNSLYTCTVHCPPGNPQAYKAAYKVSYNRPLQGLDDSGRSSPFYAEVPMAQWLEANGYDVSYMAGADVDSRGSLLLNHKIFTSTGHDEYWSAGQRASVTAARDAGVNLAFFSGNEVFWKTRWEPSIDGSGTAQRTLVTYKETHFDAPADPQDPSTWTGTWMDPRFSPPADGGRPQNALTGQLFTVNSGTHDIVVPAAYANLRIWRNTAVAKLTGSQSVTLGSGIGTLGYEWDEDADNGFRPAGEFDLSSTTAAAEVFTDYGSNTNQAGTATHHLSLYKAPSGALVFGAGSVQFVWALMSQGIDPTDVNAQQMTVNLFADMGNVQPASLLSGLVAATPSSDTTPPHSTVTSPVVNTTLADGSTTTVTGTASDVGGTVAGVEVSTDGGGTWHPATGTTNWTYSWTVHGYPATAIRTRAVDDSGNIETPSAGTSVNVVCPCSVFGNKAPVTADVDSADTASIEVGMKFTPSVAGTITGVRFYKAAKNTGTHTANLWSSGGTLLATGTFSGESASGWQQMTFTSPVAVTAGTTYVVSYFAPSSHYSFSIDWFYPAGSAPGPDGPGLDNSALLHPVLATGGNSNGVYKYAAASSFPTTAETGEYQGANFWVDALFTPSSSGPIAPGAPSGVTATAANASASVSWTAPSNGGSAITSYTVTPFIGASPQTPTVISGNPPATSATVTGLTNGTTYTFTVAATNAIGTGAPSTASNAVTPTAPTAPGAPSAVTATAANASASVSWTAPSNGGSAITSYTVTPFIGASPQTPTVISGNPPATSATVTGLTNGTTYTFTVAATNAIGTGAPSTASNAVTPTAPTAPGAPSAVTATAANASASVSWTAPSNGGSAITSYTVTPFIGASPQTPTVISGNPPATSATVTGLTNGTTYTFTVAATNAIGTGAPSTASNAVTPALPTSPVQDASVSVDATTGVATTPTFSTVQAGELLVATVSSDGPTAGGQTSTVTGAGLSWTLAARANTQNGTAEIWTATAAGTLTNVAVTATAAVSGYQQLLTVTSFESAAGVGATKTAGAATGAPTLSITTTKPLSVVLAAGMDWDNATARTVGSGQTIATQWVDTGAGDTFWTQQPTAPVATAGAVTINDTAPTGDRWDLAAIEIIGAAQAAPTAPGAPTGVTATAGNGSASVSWTAPANGGSPITSYAVTPHAGATTLTPTVVSGNPPATSTTVTGLTNGTSYTFTVTATNAVGTGAASTASNAVTPSAPTVPGAPTAVTATAGNGSASVSWTAPTVGSPITSYAVTPHAGATTLTPTVVSGNPPATSTTVTGLTNGTSYTFTVTATNAVGTGAASTASNAVTPSAAPTPTFVQQVSTHVTNATKVAVAPTANVATGNRLVVLVGVWHNGNPTTASVTDSAGNTYTELLHFVASEGTEMSVWTAPITAGGGTKPTITATPTATADIGISVMEYAGLSTAAGTAAIDQSAHASATTGAAATVASGATPATTAAGELAIGFYTDSGFGDTLAAGAGYTARTNISNTGDIELLTEDQLLPTAPATPSATIATGASTTWEAAVVVFKHG